MKRRMLLLVPFLGWAGRAMGQDPERRTRSMPRGRAVSGDGGEDAPARRATRATPKGKGNETSDDAGPGVDPNDQIPGNFPKEAGFEWRDFNITPYTSLLRNESSPQTAILDWIFRRTETGPWHGDKIAVLCASKSRLRAYNSTKVLNQVAETVEQFTKAQADVLTVRVRFIAAGGTQWRYTNYSTLKSVGNGPQGQQIWQTSEAEAEQLVAQMKLWKGFEPLLDQKYKMINGQTMTVKQQVDKPYPASAQRSGAVGMGVQPKVDTLIEGMVLRFSPLLSYEGDTLDAAIELSTNLVRKFHSVKVLGPREVGTGEVTLDVPEVSETRLNQAVKTWPLGEALVISTGIQPGLLLDKRGLLGMGISWTAPSTTEILAIINVAIAYPDRTAEPADRSRDKTERPAARDKPTRERSDRGEAESDEPIERNRPTWTERDRTSERERPDPR